MKPKRYEPRVSHNQEAASLRRNENLAALLQACERLVIEWPGQRELDAKDAAELGDQIARIKEALAALGWITEEP